MAIAAAEAGTELDWPGWTRSRALQHFEVRISKELSQKMS